MAIPFLGRVTGANSECWTDFRLQFLQEGNFPHTAREESPGSDLDTLELESKLSAFRTSHERVGSETAILSEVSVDALTLIPRAGPNGAKA